MQAKPFFEKVLLMGVIYYVQFAKYVFVWWFAVSIHHEISLVKTRIQYMEKTLFERVEYYLGLIAPKLF